LRRDEVATLAGVSLSYYSRLEQGRELSPSLGVLEALARVLRLGDEDRRELFRLARPTTRRTKSPFRVERVRPHLRQLIDGWTRTPALRFLPGVNARGSSQEFAEVPHQQNPARGA
jgi:transcriptional regulator with XRE-family HTH domain